MLPLQTVSRQQQVAERIRQYITEHHLKPGDRLPGEEWFATSLGVGRPLVREALKGLEAVGAVEVRQGVGRFVGAFEAESYVRHFTTEVLLQSFTERELTEARCLLEIAAVSEAVARLTDDDLAEVHRLFAEMENRAAQGEPYTEADLGMHRVIMSGAGNRLVTAMLDAMYALGVARVRDQTDRARSVAEDLAEHRALAEAVLARDGRAARAALMDHFETTAGRLGFTPHWRELFDADLVGGGRRPRSAGA